MGMLVHEAVFVPAPNRLELELLGLVETSLHLGQEAPRRLDREVPLGQTEVTDPLDQPGQRRVRRRGMAHARGLAGDPSSESRFVRGRAESLLHQLDGVAETPLETLYRRA